MKRLYSFITVMEQLQHKCSHSAWMLVLILRFVKQEPLILVSVLLNFSVEICDVQKTFHPFVLKVTNILKSKSVFSCVAISLFLDGNNSYSMKRCHY